jgi:hypothetical protein
MHGRKGVAEGAAAVAATYGIHAAHPWQRAPQLNQFLAAFGRRYHRLADADRSFGTSSPTCMLITVGVHRRFTCGTQLIRQRRSVTGGVAALHRPAAGICRPGRAAIER